MTDTDPFEWDAATYDSLPLPHIGWGQGVLDRLAPGSGDTVMDMGCGTGRDTVHLLDRLPEGRVVAVDGSEQMLEQLRGRAGDRADRVEVVQADLRRPFGHAPAVDRVMSVATFHWLPDHAVVFRSVRGVLKPGGPFVAEAGGDGNIAQVRRALAELGVDGGGSKWNFAGVDDTVALLRSAGFVDIEARLVADPIHLEPGHQLEAFLATVVLGPDLAELPAPERMPFVRAVAARLPDAVVDYVRLQFEAVRAEGPDPMATASPGRLPPTPLHP